MPKGYWIGRVEVKSEEGYKPYAMGNQAIFKKFGGRYVIRAGKYECVEGEARSRNVVIEFPDYATALACYTHAKFQGSTRSSTHGRNAARGRRRRRANGPHAGQGDRRQQGFCACGGPRGRAFPAAWLGRRRARRPAGKRHQAHGRCRG